MPPPLAPAILLTHTGMLSMPHEASTLQSGLCYSKRLSATSASWCNSKENPLLPKAYSSAALDSGMQSQEMLPKMERNKNSSKSKDTDENCCTTLPLTCAAHCCSLPQLSTQLNGITRPATTPAAPTQQQSIEESSSACHPPWPLLSS